MVDSIGGGATILKRLGSLMKRKDIFPHHKQNRPPAVGRKASAELRGVSIPLRGLLISNRGGLNPLKDLIGY